MVYPCHLPDSAFPKRVSQLIIAVQKASSKALRKHEGKPHQFVNYFYCRADSKFAYRLYQVNWTKVISTILLLN